MKTLLLLILASLTTSTFAASTYPTRLDDPEAVYLTPQEFRVHGDGQRDDSEAVQAAIDKLQSSKGEGIVFIPQGRYRISRTIYLWPGVRLIGYGPQRPVFVLGENTPGYQDGIAYMFFFAGARPPVRGLPISSSAYSAWNRAAHPQRSRRQPRHLLFGDQQRRFRNRPGQFRSGRHSLSLSSALFSQPHRLFHRLWARGSA